MTRIYGGVIGAPSTVRQDSIPFFMPDKSILMTNGRSVLHLLATVLMPKTVWLPNYHCPVMASAFSSRIVFYEVSQQLEVNPAFISGVQPNDVVVFINYFGLQHNHDLGKRVCGRRAWVIEDSCMGLYTTPSGVSHFVVKSLSKNLGLADGAILINQCVTEFDVSNFVDPPAGWIKIATSARDGRREYDAGLTNSRDWFKEYVQAKKLAPCGLYAISRRSALDFKGYDYNLISSLQKRNWLLFGQLLGKYALPTMYADENPGGFFPILVGNRNRLQERLFEDGIYAAFHWGRGQWNFLSLPSDWRYNEHEIAYIADRVEFHLNNA